ncbi:F-box/WD-40 repeat-containing protein At3g52030 isoform X2 [Cryptomeria japonica]|uniref:F-box/WD-40 repeat-containing protein At3g52030 isoform X2 n=1 Tax=Cryptomeria japonica TaxID=3369 RepID=UPI0025ABDC57|nr:F-box/WD-40 repeat-containing protein At3g52030 isoform X2 [Cryptomeria japonica]
MTSYKENDRSLKRRKNPINDVGADVLLKIFSYLDLLDLARASTVNRSWHSIIERSSLWRDAYYMQRHEFLNHSKDDTLSETSPKDWVRQLMSEQHKSALVHGSGQVCCWKGHSTGVNKCRMRMESILTGVGDQIVGLVGGDICIWKRHGNRHLLRGHIQRAYCMCYVDPEAAVGCGDGTIRIFDMYSSQCSRIFREHSGAVTCLSIADERFLISGSSLGSLSVADVVSGQKVASLRQPTAPTGISCLWVKQGSFEVFSGTTSGHAYCWDLRTHKQLWEMRVSSNEIYSIHSLAIDLKTLALGGIDGILRIIDAKSGEILSSYVPAAKMTNISGGLVAKCSASKVSSPIDRIPKSIRRPITCVAVGLNKIVTTHNDKNIMLWTFQRTKVK